MKHILAACILSLLTPLTAFSDPVSQEDMARIEVLQGWQDGATKRVFAVKITLADGWHTYWRSPGDAGIAPTITLDQAAAIHWPTPTLFSQSGFSYLGYENHVILPIEVADTSASNDQITVKLDLGVCNDA